MTLQSRDSLRISGKIKINTYRAGMVEIARPLLNQIKRLKRLPESDYRELSLGEATRVLNELRRAYFLECAVQCPNLIMDSPGYGLDLIIQRLVGNNTYSLNIGWIEIGTGTTTPTVNDTALTTPALRSAVSYQEDYGATDAIVQTYITDADLPNGTYTEVGSFIDGTSAIGSGQIFNHALLSPTYSKVSGEDTTIEIDLSIANS